MQLQKHFILSLFRLGILTLVWKFCHKTLGIRENESKSTANCVGTVPLAQCGITAVLSATQPLAIIIIIIIITKPQAEILKLNNVNGCNDISFGDQSILEGDRISPLKSHGQALEEEFCFPGVLSDNRDAPANLLRHLYGCLMPCTCCLDGKRTLGCIVPTNYMYRAILVFSDKKIVHNLKITGQILLQLYITIYRSRFTKSNKVGVRDLDLLPYKK